MAKKDIEIVSDDVVADVNATEVKTMTVKEFIDLYESDKTKDKTEVAKQLVITPYIDYEVKIALAENIVNRANINSETGNVVLNSPLRFIFYAFTVVNRYTNVRIGAGDMLGDFNALNSRGLVEYLMRKIPEKELSEFTTVVDMVADDLIANKCGVKAAVDDTIKEFLNFINQIIDAVGSIGDQLKDIDFEKLTADIEKATQAAK